MKRSLRLSLLVISALWFVATVACAADLPKRGLEIFWIDSEGGGSTLILTPAGESVLIDTGNPGGRDSGRIVAAARAAGTVSYTHLTLPTKRIV